MPTDVRTYRVFLASPSGLEAEQEAFRSALNAYNESDAFRRGVSFKPELGGEALGGVGRAQALINPNIEAADFFFLLLWDRWGSPPDLGGPYSSAVEEEFSLAMKCYASPDHPMRQVVVCFKAVSPQRLADADDQLLQVLEFKAKLEREKAHHFHTFETLDDIAAIVRRHLGQWLWDHEQGGEKELPPAPVPAVAVPMEVVPQGSISSERLLERALALSGTERHTEAEILFACALSTREHPEILFPYGLLLLRLGRLRQAEELFWRALRASESVPAPEWMGRAHTGLGHLLLQRGDLQGAELEYRSALDKEREYRRMEGIANAYGNIANVHMRVGALEQAEQAFRAAMDAHKEIGNRINLGIALASIANIRTMRGDYAHAEALYEQAIDTFDAEGHADFLAMTYTNLGNIYISQEDWRRAEGAFTQALVIAKRVQNLETLATAYGNLGTVFSGRGDLDAAERMYQQALEIDQGLGRLEGLANVYAYVGNVLSRRNQFDDAIARHHQALALEERLGRLAGMANTFCNLGNVLFRKGDFAGAVEMHRKAISIEQSLGETENLAKSHMYLADAFAALGNAEQAETNYRRAVGLFARLRLDLRVQEAGNKLAALDSSGRREA